MAGDNPQTTPQTMAEPRSGWWTDPSRRRTIRRFSNDEDKHIESLRINGSSLSIISRIIGRTPSTVLQRLNKLARDQECEDA